MDLSKIPEPTEEDLSDARFFLSHHPYSAGDRLIAHILRHGSVLAKNWRLTQDMGYKIICEDERAAVEFFEKFGGNDER